MNGEKRVHLRHPVKLLIEIKPSRGQAEVVTETEDLSRGGVSFYVDWKLPEGQRVVITFIMNKKKFRVKGKVAYSREYTESWYFLTGVEFIETRSRDYVKFAERLGELIRLSGGVNKAPSATADRRSSETDRRSQKRTQ
ncbi:MAG: PilZ domain-containing protein [Candidatus Omnitrophota bacterium]